jgi:hypothetical protein
MTGGLKGNTLLTRTYFLSNDAEKRSVLQFEIGIPERTDFEEEEYVCHYRISYRGEEKIGSSYGIDSVQAFLLSLAAIRAKVLDIHEALDQSLRWIGDDRGDTGINIPSF